MALEVTGSSPAVHPKYGKPVASAAGFAVSSQCFTSRFAVARQGVTHETEGGSVTIVRDSFYINGAWVKASSSEVLEVTSSGTGELYATIPVGTVD